jgi:alpha-galactosidase
VPKITLIGAGSSAFAKNLLGDCMLTPSMAGSRMMLYDIDRGRLDRSKRILDTLNRNLGGHAEILTTSDRTAALSGADFVLVSIAVGEYDPVLISDFEIPRKYGLDQIFADTLGMGGLFRGLRTVPILIDMAREMERECPDAMLINYTNPMAIVTGALQRATRIRTVGLCHSVQVCAEELLHGVGMEFDEQVRWRIAGINHQSWLLDIRRAGVDLYPEIKARALACPDDHPDRIRYVLMKLLGYFVTESSSHSAEYVPFFLKRQYPELVKAFSLKPEGYKDWGRGKAAHWHEMEELAANRNLTHVRSREYASYIMDASLTNTPVEIAGNVLNRGGLISNLPEDACVEVPCLVDANGIQPVHFGALPPQCAALNRTNINMQLLTIEAAMSGKKEQVYQAAMLDPHTLCRAFSGRHRGRVRRDAGVQSELSAPVPLTCKSMTV